MVKWYEKTQPWREQVEKRRRADGTLKPPPEESAAEEPEKPNLGEPVAPAPKADEAVERIVPSAAALPETANVADATETRKRDIEPVDEGVDDALAEPKSEDDDGSKEDDRGWTQAQRDLITDAHKAIMAKDKRGRNMIKQLEAMLQEDDRMIDENAFFESRGAYSQMMRNEPAIMRATIDEYRKLQSSAPAEKQQHADLMEAKLKLLQEGELTRSGLKEFKKEIEAMREEIRHAVNGAPAPETAGQEQATDAKPVRARSAPQRIPLIAVPFKEKQDMLTLKNERSKTYKEDGAKRFSLINEMADVVYSNNLQWDGEGTTSWLAADYDDKMNSADIVKYAERTIRGTRVKREYIVNTTDAAVYGIQKTANTLRFIDNAFLSTLDFGITKADIHGIESQGKHRLVPHLNYVISRPLLAEITLLQKMERYDMLALHPVQLMRLLQGHAQVNAFLEYIETEHARDPRRGRANKAQVQKAFSDLKDLFASAIEEREAVLIRELATLDRKVADGTITEKEQDIHRMLQAGSVLWEKSANNEYGESYDSEHAKYIRVFWPGEKEGVQQRRSGKVGKRGRTHAWWRLNALLEKYPPVLTDERTKKKVPVVMDEKLVGVRVSRDGPLRTVRKVPRGNEFLSGKGKESAEPVIPNPDAGETVA